MISRQKLSILIGPFKVLVNGNLAKDYKEIIVSDYMKNESITIKWMQV